MLTLLLSAYLLALLAIVGSAWLREWRATHHPMVGRRIVFETDVGQIRRTIERVESETTLTVSGGEW